MEKKEISATNHHVGSTERVYVAHVNDLNDFYLYSELNRDPLIKLGQELYNEYLDSLMKPLGTDEILHVGDYCACPSESEDWYRGLIRQVDSNGHAMVFKLDYGDVQCVPIQFLRPLKKRFFQLNRLAFHCSLVNLIRPIHGWSPDTIGEFRSRLTTTFLFAKFINYNEIRDISEVEITEKNSKTSLNKDFEKYQMQRSALEVNDRLVYKYIPMEILDSSQSYKIRLLYYISPTRFYVYLCEKLNSHTSFHVDLQQAVQYLQTISSPKKYQLVAAQDNHAIWHRAIILDCSSDHSKICVYFTDIGQKEYISRDDIRPLPEEFQRKPAFAIPCRLDNVYPIDGNEQSIWKLDDPVHDEINRIMITNVTCQVRAKQEQICYAVEIDNPKVGDLGTLLANNNLVSRSTMSYSQRPNFGSTQPPPQRSFIGAQLGLGGISPARTQQPRLSQPNDRYNNPNNIPQPSQTRTVTGLQNPPVQQPATAPTNTGAIFNLLTFPPQNGSYLITQVHSAMEFYGLSQARENELQGLSDYFENYYNNLANDQSLSASFFVDGMLFVIQHEDKYHRVVIKHRESESRVLVKLVDRGDEIIVDTSELLQIDPQCSKVHVFVQPFRLHGFDESQSSANITRNLKRLILNKRVRIDKLGAMINGFYPVEVILNDNQSVNQMLFSNDKTSSSATSIASNRPSAAQSQHITIESQIYSNSNKHHSTVNQDMNSRFNMNQRTNDILPPPQKILTGGTRTQAARFGGEGNNQVFPTPSPSTEQTSRFGNFSSRNQQQPQSAESVSSKPTWNIDQNVKPRFASNTATNQPPPFDRQLSGPTQSGANQRTVDNKMSMTNNPNRFSATNFDNQPISFEQKRSFGSGFSQDNRNEKQTSGNTFTQNNDGSTENGARRGGFSNRGSSSGFASRGGHSGFSNRTMGRNSEDNNNENNAPSSAGFSRPRGSFNDRGGNFSGRGGSFNDRGGSFNDRGGRGGSFQDQIGPNRNQGDDHNENNMQRSQNFNGSRGGFRGGRGGGGDNFQSRRDQGEGGDFGRRGGFGDRGRPRGGGFSGGRGNSRGGFQDRDNSGLQLSSDMTSSTNASSTWSTMRNTTASFEAGDRFNENEMPKDAFKFVISHIESTNDFFIQLSSKEDELSKLSDILQMEYKQSPETNIGSFKKDQACLAKHNDQCWYRAIVLSTGLSKLKVRFVDFGDTSDIGAKEIRPIAKKHCSTPPYAYPCMLNNVDVVKNANKGSIEDKCSGKQFHGKLTNKNADGKYILESDDFHKILLETNAIKSKVEVKFKSVKCRVVHIESEQQHFYIQDDDETFDKIEELIQKEEETTPTLSLEEIKQLEANAIVIARYEDEPFRGRIQSDESDENINVCFIDYGNTSSCPKTSLKRCSEQLSSYPPQSKQCQLYGISSNETNNAFKYLEEHSDSENIEIAFINEKDHVFNVLIYIDDQCLNEKFGYDPNSVKPDKTNVENEDQSKITTAEIQEEPLLVTEQQTNDDVLSTAESTLTVVESESKESEIEETTSKYRQGFLTHIEQTKPYVYLQLIPESESIIDHINELIDVIVQENRHNSSYEIGDHVIAQFNADDKYYRARIESHTTSPDSYTVYFLDYGNIDENVPADHLYSYSDELQEIEPQARGYLLDNITTDTWNDNVRALVEDKVYDTVEFYIIDNAGSVIHMKYDNENIEQIDSSTEEETKTFEANIVTTDKSCFYIRTLLDGKSQVNEIDEMLQTCTKEHQDQWSIDDRCLVSNEQNQYYRGRIITINEKKYDVKCIDYGNILQNISEEHLFVLPNEDKFQQSPLAQQCRLYGLDEEQQAQAIEDVIKHIQPTERVTITVENDSDDQCLYVTLMRENNDNVNHQFQYDHQDITENENKQESDNDEKVSPNSPDSAITADIVTTNNDNNEPVTTDTDVLQIEPTKETSEETNPSEMNSILGNGTIDFGEHDMHTIIEDETNNPISST